MKKPKHQQKTIDDDIDDLPEEVEEPDIELEGVNFDQVIMDDIDEEPETTAELTEESFNRFKDSLSMEE